MKTKLALFVIISSLVLAASAMLAQDITTNTIFIDSKSNNFPVILTLKYHDAVMCERTLGEHSLLPPGLRIK